MLITPTQFDRWVLPVEVRDADDAWVHPRRLMIFTSVTMARRSCLSGNVKVTRGTIENLPDRQAMTVMPILAPSGDQR